MKKHTENFLYLEKLGKKVELVIDDVFKQNGIELIDVSDKPQFIKIDVDRLLELADKTLKLEIKSDTKISLNDHFFLEFGFDRPTGWRKGWFHYCQADILIFLDSISGIIYLLDWKKTKNYAKNFGRQVSWWNSSDNCRSWGIVIDITDAEENDLILRTFELTESQKSFLRSEEYEIN